MEFWGVEVKVGKPKLVQPGEDSVIHLSQACLVEVKKGNEKEPVHLYVNTANQKLCIGTLSSEKIPQIAFDLVFDNNFEVSHTSKSGSVHLSGYKTSLSEFNSGDTANLNEAKIGNAVTTEHKNKKVLEPGGEVNHDSESDSSDAFDSSDDEDTPNAKKVSIEEAESDDDEDGSDSDDEDEDESDKEAQIKASQSNKREKDSSFQAHVPAKKAKLVTPQKTARHFAISVGGKSSGGHVATPYPTKTVAKTSGNSDKSKPQSHEFRCNPCNRTFGSENALQSHSKAKHGLK